MESGKCYFGHKKLFEHKLWTTAKKKIYKWLDKFTNPSNMFGACIVIGDIGVGKTSLILNLLQNRNYNITYITPNTMPSNKDVGCFFHDNITSQNLEDIMCGKPRKKAIVIDEIENINFKHKACLLKFLSWVYPSKKKDRRSVSIEMGIPFFFIGRHTHIKALQTAIKHCLRVDFDAPCLKDQIRLMKRLCSSHGLTSYKEAIKNMITFCHNDLRRLELMGKEFIQCYDKLTVVNLRKFLCQYIKINPQLGVMWSACNVLNGNVEFDSVNDLYQQDKYLLPLMVHENYPRLIRGKTNPEFVSRTQEIANLLMSFDQFDTHMYRHQYWSLQELCGMLICGGTASIVNRSNIDTKLELKDIQFTKHLNRTSLVTVRNKMISDVVSKTNICTMDGLYYLKKSVFPTDNLDEPDPKMVNRFGLDEHNLTRLFKIDIIPSVKKKAVKKKK